MLCATTDYILWHSQRCTFITIYSGSNKHRGQKDAQELKYSAVEASPRGGRWAPPTTRCNKHAPSPRIALDASPCNAKGMSSCYCFPCPASRCSKAPWHCIPFRCSLCLSALQPERCNRPSPPSAYTTSSNSIFMHGLLWTSITGTPCGSETVLSVLPRNTQHIAKLTMAGICQVSRAFLLLFRDN